MILTLWPNAAGSGLVYSTFLGGSSVDQGEGFAVDTAGNPYVTGETDRVEGDLLDRPAIPSGHVLLAPHQGFETVGNVRGH